jgi:hypothetical protein
VKRLIGSLTTVLGLGVAWAGETVPDFKLTDENPNSIRWGTPVSPRDYVLQVAGFFFGTAS